MRSSAKRAKWAKIWYHTWARGFRVGPLSVNPVQLNFERQRRIQPHGVYFGLIRFISLSCGG